MRNRLLLSLLSLALASGCTKPGSSPNNAPAPRSDAAPNKSSTAGETTQKPQWPAEATEQQIPAVAAQDPPAGWHKTTSQDGAFTVEFPGKPEYAAEDDGQGNKFHGYQYQTDDETAAFFVMHWQLGDQDLADGPQAVLAGLAESITGDPDGGEKITLDSFPGREHKFQTEEGGMEVTVWQRAFVVNNRVYQVFLQTAGNELPKNDARRFLDSFKLASKPLAAAEPSLTTTDDDKPKANWQNYTFAEAGFSADFPNKPLHFTEGDEEEGITHNYEAGVEGSEVYYTVMYDDLPKDAVEAGPEAILAGVAESTAELTTSKKKITLCGHPGMELLMEFEEDGVPLVIRNRIYLVQSRMFQVMVAAPAGDKAKAEFDRFLDSFKILLPAAPEPEEPPDEASVSGRVFKLTGRTPWPAILQSSQAAATAQGLTIGRSYVRTRQRDFLTRDFRFEAVFSIKEGDSIVFVGLGEGRGGGAYKEPVGSVYLRIHHKSLSGVELGKGGRAFGNRRVGAGLPTGVHRAVVTKEGDAVTFAIDVDDDGATDDDMELTVPDIRAFEPALHSKNTHLFFGGGGAFREIKLTFIEASDGNPPSRGNRSPPEAARPVSPEEPKTAKITENPTIDPPAAAPLVVQPEKIAAKTSTPRQTNLPRPTPSRPAAVSPPPSAPDVPATQIQAISFMPDSAWPSFLQPGGKVTTDGLHAGGAFIRTRASGFHERDFEFEIVFTLDAGEEQVAFGIGDSQGKCVKMQVNAPDSRFQGRVGLWKHGYKRRALYGQVTSHGPHRVIITKRRDAVTFAIDVDNDGPTPNDMQRTVMDFRNRTPYLDDTGALLFFGHGGVYSQVRLTVD